LNWREEDHEMKTKDKKGLMSKKLNWREEEITNWSEEENQVESNNISRWSWNQLESKSIKNCKKKKHEER